jgi:hypothetical protein
MKQFTAASHDIAGERESGKNALGTTTNRERKQTEHKAMRECEKERDDKEKQTQHFTFLTSRTWYRSIQSLMRSPRTKPHSTSMLVRLRLRRRHNINLELVKNSSTIQVSLASPPSPT